MLDKDTLYHTLIPNVWANILAENYELLTPKNQEYADKFQNIKTVSGIKNFHNLFCLDGYSMECICELSENLQLLKKMGKKIKLPVSLDTSKSSIFYNRAEGWARDDFFQAIHNIIDLIELKGKIVYANASYNLSDVYLTFCKKHNLDPKIECVYNGNPSFHNIDNNHYKLPNKTPLIVRIEDRKLYCSFNWNPWDHRMALISMLHYYDLIHLGYVTSPGIEKFEYNKEYDFNLLVSRTTTYLDDFNLKNEVLQKLSSLRPYYPLTIDDRTKYTHTDEPLTTPELKHPLFSARLNSIFEIICETRFFGEHFFSEKTFNPIALGKPFLYFTSAGALKSLHKLGYKSFGSLIDESYDNIENNAERINAVTKELRRLQDMREKNPKNFYELCEQLYVIAQYNLEHFTIIGYRNYNHHNNYKQYMRFMTVC